MRPELFFSKLRLLHVHNTIGAVGSDRRQQSAFVRSSNARGDEACVQAIHDGASHLSKDRVQTSSIIKNQHFTHQCRSHRHNGRAAKHLPSLA